MPKKSPAPTVVESSPEEHFAENIATLRLARKITEKVFGLMSKAALIGAAEVVRNLGEDLAESTISAARDVARKIALPHGSGDVYAVVDILLEDEKGEEHLTSAAAIAREFFGAATSLDDAVDIYYEIYGEDEEEDVFED